MRDRRPRCGPPSCTAWGDPRGGSRPEFRCGAWRGYHCPSSPENADGRLFGPESLSERAPEVSEMATTWEMIAICVEDAVRAEDLVKELAFRRELRIDPQKALSAFELRAKPAR